MKLRILMPVCLAVWLLAAGAAVCRSAQDQAASPSDNSLQVQSYAISVQGNSSLGEQELLKAAAVELQLFAQRGYRKADIDDAAFQMRAAYLQAGYAFALVDYDYEKKGDRVQVIFDINEGPQVTVANIRATGMLQQRSFWPCWGHRKKTGAANSRRSLLKPPSGMA
jgi:hypothetical protein